MQVSESKREDKEEILPESLTCEMSHDETVEQKASAYQLLVYNERVKGAGNYYSQADTGKISRMALMCY